MDFLVDFPKLEAAQKQRFQDVVTRLLAGEVIDSGTALKPDPDWRFVDRFRELIDSYLMVGGWRLDIDLGLRIARAVHETGAQRVRFSKLESLVLCTLRLEYHEHMRAASEKERCDVTVGALRERMVAAGKPAAQLSSRVLAPALRKLMRHSLVRVARGFEARDEEVVGVNPLIEKVLPPDRIHELAERVRRYAESKAASPGSGEDDDGAEAVGEDASS